MPSKTDFCRECGALIYIDSRTGLCAPCFKERERVKREQRVCARPGCEESFVVRVTRSKRFCSLSCAAYAHNAPLKWRYNTMWPMSNGYECMDCDAPAVDRHHIDGNHYNDAPSNIVMLCRRCHMLRDGRISSHGPSELKATP